MVVNSLTHICLDAFIHKSLELIISEYFCWHNWLHLNNWLLNLNSLDWCLDVSDWLNNFDLLFHELIRLILVEINLD